MPASPLLAAMVAMASSARGGDAGVRQRGADRRLDVGRGRAASAADAGDDHGFVQAHCVTGIAGRQPVFVAHGAGARDRDADQLAAERGVARDQQRFGFERHRVDHEAAARTQALRPRRRARRVRRRRRR